MKRLLVFSLLFTSMNTFGQDGTNGTSLPAPTKKNSFQQAHYDLNFYQKYLKNCQDTYKELSSKFTNFTPPQYIPEPMVADTTAVYISEEQNVRRVADQTKAAYEKCDQKLRADAELNHVILPTIQDVIDHTHLNPPNSQYQDWECWAGLYRPAIFTLNKETTKKQIVNGKTVENVKMAENTWLTYRSYEHHTKSFHVTPSKPNEFWGLENGSITMSKGASNFIQFYVDAEGEKLHYNCVPLNHNKYKIEDVKANTGAAKTRSKLSVEVEMKNNDTIQD